MKEDVMSTDTLIADRIEIADLFTRFARLLDEGRHEAGFIRQAEVEGEHTQHMTTDLLVNVDGDQAAASANSLVFFYRDGRAPHQTSGMRLAGTVVRTPTGCRFRDVRIMLAWMHEN
jgi:hypothetical protein